MQVMPGHPVATASTIPCAPFTPSATTVNGLALDSKRALTWCAWVIERTHGAVPEQAPDQPANAVPGSGIAVSVTLAPSGSSSSQLRGPPGPNQQAPAEPPPG